MWVVLNIILKVILYLIFCKMRNLTALNILKVIIQLIFNKKI
jgi:hypothetical protein